MTQQRKRRSGILAFSIGFLLVFLVLVFGLPNAFNSRERQAFSDQQRLERARQSFRIANLGDSVNVVPGEFYKRGALVQFLLGSANREIWQQKVTVPVLDVQAQGLRPLSFSGRKQSIGIKLLDSMGVIWKARSVNKDQSAVLAPFLRSSILRPMLRDQACALNPYSSLIVAKLAPLVQIHYDDPKLYFFPYDARLGKYNDRMAGRLVSLARDRDEGNTTFHGEQVKIINTAELLSRYQETPLDTALYLRTRLFDILVSDWDRHKDNWKWMVRTRDNRQIIEPVGEDRDIAFYNFGDGVLNKFTLLFVELFASFKPDYDDMKALMEESKILDVRFLKGQNKRRFLKEVAFIRKHLSTAALNEAFKVYPPETYRLVGREHERILNQRLKTLDRAAMEFYRLIQKEDPQ